MPDQLHWLLEELLHLDAEQLNRRRRCIRAEQDGWCSIDGQRLRNFASNDYLNLAHDDRLIEAACQAAKESGVGARASALVCGRTNWHSKLEKELADFEGQEAALLFPSGFAANTGTIPTLVNEQDVIFSDRLNHASLIDGCRLSKAQIRIYRHDRIDELERQMQDSGSFRRRLIVTDSVFSMDGDLAPLEEIAWLGKKYDAAILIDEAHGTGVFGRKGRGVAEHLGVESEIDIRIGTLSKSLGSLGGFVTGSRKLIEWLWNRARSQIFSTALPAAACAAASRALEIIASEPDRRKRLLEMSDRFRRELSAVGLATPENSVGPIVPLILHDPSKAVRAAEELESRGFLVGAIRPPTVPVGTSRLRIALSCAHTDEDLRRLLAALVDVFDQDK